MRESLKSFFFISVVTFFGLLGLAFFALNRSLSEPVNLPSKHPFLETQYPLMIAYRGSSAEAPANSVEAITRAAELDPNAVIWIDVAPDRAGQLVLDSPSKEPAKDGKPVPLSDILSRFPARKFILNLRENRPGFLETVIATIDQAQAADRILVQSPEDALLRDLREKKPQWLFGTSQAQTTLMQMLASIAMEPLAPKKGDVFVLEWRSRAAENQGVSDRVISEVHRRRMKIFVGPVRTEEQAAALRARGVDGIITQR